MYLGYAHHGGRNVLRIYNLIQKNRIRQLLDLLVLRPENLDSLVSRRDYEILWARKDVQDVYLGSVLTKLSYLEITLPDVQLEDGLREKYQEQLFPLVVTEQGVGVLDLQAQIYLVLESYPGLVLPDKLAVEELEIQE